MTNTTKQFIGWLLWWANADKPTIDSDKFYVLKGCLLNKYGEHRGYCWQHIVKKCWTCDGTGMFNKQERCRRCWNGVYDEVWIQHSKWTLGGSQFLTPVDETRNKALVDGKCEVHGQSVEIEGYVKHDVDCRLSNEARLWLYLIFDRRMFWRELKGHSYAKPRGLLSRIQRYVMPTVLAWRNRTWVRRCVHCQRVRLRTRYNMRPQCRGCQSAEEERFENEGVPF